MTNPDDTDVTLLLGRMAGGDHAAGEQVVEQLYPILRKVALSRMRFERPDHTLGATGLVNEAWLKIMGSQIASWDSRRAFVKACGKAMEHLLLDHARSRGRLKRGGGRERVELGTAIEIASLRSSPLDHEEFLDLASALDELDEMDAKAGEVVRARAILGMTGDEAAATFGVSRGTVTARFRRGRDWLRERLGWTVSDGGRDSDG